MQIDNRLLWYSMKSEDVSEHNFISSVSNYIAKLPLLLDEADNDEGPKKIYLSNRL